MDTFTACSPLGGVTAPPPSDRHSNAFPPCQSLWPSNRKQQTKSQFRKPSTQNAHTCTHPQKFQSMIHSVHIHFLKRKSKTCSVPVSKESAPSPGHWPDEGWKLCIVCHLSLVCINYKKNRFTDFIQMRERSTHIFYNIQLHTHTTQYTKRQDRQTIISCWSRLSCEQLTCQSVNCVDAVNPHHRTPSRKSIPHVPQLMVDSLCHRLFS